MRVLLTRSEPGIEETAAAVRALGWVADLAPALQIVPCPPLGAALAEARVADHWAFVSPHAVQHGEPLLPRQLPAVHCYAVGPATAAALAARGHAVRHAEGSGSAASLLAAPELRAVAGQRWVVVRGRGGLPLLPDSLRERGAHVVLLEVYERQPLTPASLRAAWHDPDAVVVSSGDGLAALLAAATAANIPLTQRPLLVPSERVAAHARAVGVARVIVCAGAGSAAVCAALQREFGDSGSTA